MKLKDFGEKSTITTTNPKIAEAAGNDVAMYMIKEIADKIMYLDKVYNKFKNLGNTQDAEKVKHKMAQLAAQKREMEAAAGMDVNEEELNEITDKIRMNYVPAANDWRAKQGWPDDPKIIAKANRRAAYTQMAINRLYANNSADQKQAKAQQPVQESADIDQQIEMLQSALQRARAATKAIKHDDTLTSIIVEIQQIAREVGISEKEFSYEVNAAIEAKNALESAVYSLEDIFADKLRDLELQRDEQEINEGWGADTEDTFRGGYAIRHVKKIGDHWYEILYKGQQIGRVSDYGSALKIMKSHMDANPDLAQGTPVDEARGADNFTADDLTALSAIADIDAMKAKAKELIATPSKRPMKPEKIAWFNDAIDGQTNRNGIIKLMYDLLLSGEGNSVLGTRYSMSSNSYRKRFSEEINEADQSDNSPKKTHPWRDANAAKRIAKSKERDKRDAGNLHRKESPSATVSSIKKTLQFVQDKESEDVDEGMQGGINRAAPAQDVSYEKILNDVTDLWRGQKTKVTELKVSTLRAHEKGVKELDPLKTPKYKLVKHIEGGKESARQIARKTGDRTSSSYPVKTYEERLNKFLKD